METSIEQDIATAREAVAATDHLKVHVSMGHTPESYAETMLIEYPDDGGQEVLDELERIIGYYKAIEESGG